MPQPQQQPAEVRREAVLEAAHPLPAGTLIRPADFHWREIEPGEVRPGTILRKDASEAEYFGAIARRDFAGGEPLTAADLVKTTDRRFLSAVLKPGTRAVTIAVDAPQGSSGMVLPGDRVDVVLTQNLGGRGWRSLSQNRCRNGLRNVRVIAVDQRLNLQARPAPAEAVPEKETAAKEPRMPRTVTLELNEAQAEKLFVAAQLGGLQLPVRSLEGCRGALVRRETFQRPPGHPMCRPPSNSFRAPKPRRSREARLKRRSAGPRRRIEVAGCWQLHTGPKQARLLTARETAPGGIAARVFVTDQESEGVIRESLAALGVQGAHFTAGDVTYAIAALAKETSPQLLVVDISGIADPLSKCAISRTFAAPTSQ